jgi:hypothetical protein
MHQDINIIEPPADLFDKIMRSVAREYRRWLAIKISVALVVGLSALGACISVWRELLSELSESGFLQYSSFVATDFRTVIAAWQDYGLTLLESLPVVRLFELCVVAFVLVLAVHYSISYLFALQKKIICCVTKN